MDQKEFITKSARETEGAGERFAEDLKTGDVVVLTGELGAGKTTFVQGIAKALSIKSRVISPTFVLIRKHHGKLKHQKINLYHIDLYRLDSSDDIQSLGLSDIFEDVRAIFIIEWGEKHGELATNWEVKFEILSKNTRKIVIHKNE